MLINAIGDLHGHLPKLPESDLLLIAGDIFPMNIVNDPYKAMKWFEEVFIRWCKDQETWEIAMVAGTRDWPIQVKNQSFKEAIKKYSHWFHYLENEYKELEIEGIDISIFGTPYSIERGHWAFTKTHKELDELFLECPTKVDIILSHDAPYGITDVPFGRLFEMYHDEDPHQGSKPLRRLLNKTDFKYNFHGNLHSSKRGLEPFTNGFVTNTSYVDESNKPYENYESILIKY